MTNTSTNADHQHARNKDIAPKKDQALLLHTLLQMPINIMQEQRYCKMTDHNRQANLNRTQENA